MAGILISTMQLKFADMEKKENNKDVKQESAEVEAKQEEKNTAKSTTEKKDSKAKETESKSTKKTKKKTVSKKDKELQELSTRVEELGDKYIRLSAEFDNYRKRTLKEKMELSKSAGKQIFENMLPVIDDLERAIESIKAADDIEAVKEGMDLIHTKFIGFLKQQGVSPMDSIGSEFNTDEHEAITKIPAPSEDMKGKVVDVVTKGYKINDQILRFSKVVVGE